MVRQRGTGPTLNMRPSSWISSPNPLNAARELVLTVESLHTQGIVHGAIHGRNIIIDPKGRVRLTHISPYLYTDAQVDAAAVVDVLRELAESCEAEGPGLASVLPGEDHPVESLRTLGMRITAQLEMRQQPAPEEADVRDARHQRRRSMMGAVGALLVGVLSAAALHRTMSSASGAAAIPPDARILR